MAADPIPPQEFVIRTGDDLPTLAAVIEDEYGEPVDLTGAHVYLVVQSERDHDPIASGAMYVPNPPAGVVTFDWDRRITVDFPPGVYQMYVTVVFADGSRLTAPSDRSSTIVVRPGLVTLLTTHDDVDLLTAGGDQYVIDEYGPDAAAAYFRRLLERTGRPVP